MAQTLDTLVVELVLNSAAFAAQSKGVEKALNGIKTAAQATGLVVAAMFVKSGISQFVAQAQELGNLSRSVRENAEDLQAWGEAVKREGGTAEGFNATVKKLSDDLMSIPLTGGNSPLLGGLTRLGVQFRNLDGSMRKPLAVLKDLSTRFQGMSAAQSLALGKKLGLDEATIRLLQKGRKGLDELLVKYKELGVMSNQDIKTGERLKKMFQDYQQVITALGLRFIRFFLPAAEKVSQWLLELNKWIGSHGRQIEAFLMAAGVVISGVLVVALYKMRGALLANAAAALKMAAALLANPLTWMIAAVIALGVAIGLIIEDFLAWKEGADSALAPIWEWFSKLGDKIDWLKEKWASFVDWIKDTKLGKLVREVKDFFSDDNDIGKSLPEVTEKISHVNSGARAVQALKSGNSQSINNSRTVNQSSHIDKVIVNNPDRTFNETMNEAVSSASVNNALQLDGYMG